MMLEIKGLRTETLVKLTRSKPIHELPVSTVSLCGREDTIKSRVSLGDWSLISLKVLARMKVECSKRWP